MRAAAGAGSITGVMDSSATHIIDPAFAGMSFADVCALAHRQQAQIKHISAINAKMAHEMAVLKRLKFAASSERFGPEQKSLLEEAIDEDLQALDREIGKLEQPPSKRARSTRPSARRYRPTCRAEMSSTSPRTPAAQRRVAAAK